MDIKARQQETQRFEIERKFLVDTIHAPDFSQYPRHHITQQYLVVTNDTEVRVRKQDDLLVLTIKHGAVPKREEIEIEIGVLDYKRLAMISSPPIKKIRYLVPYGDRTIEVDAYEAPQQLVGRTVAELEFSTEAEMAAFVPPRWMSTDITFVERYKNKNLGIADKQQEGTQKIYGVINGAEEAVREVKEKLQLGRPVVVAVAGGSNSGKTGAVAARIAKAFGDKAVLISADDYYHDRQYLAEQLSKGVQLNWDHPGMVDMDRLRKDIISLQEGHQITKPIYSPRVGGTIGYQDVKPAQVIVIEGLFVHNQDIRQIGDVKVFVDSTDHSRFIRKHIRDPGNTGQTPEQITAYFLNTIEPMHQMYIAPEVKNADIVIRNDYVPAIEASGIRIHDAQAKFGVNSDIFKVLDELGAAKTKETRQTDTYYQTKTGSRDPDECIRVREENSTITFTYKVPVSIQGPELDRYRIEAKIEKDTEARIANMYRAVGVIEKERHAYILDGIPLTVDRVIRETDGRLQEFGWFIEFTFKDEVEKTEKTPKLKGRLGIPDAKEIKVPYIMLKVGHTPEMPALRA